MHEKNPSRMGLVKAFKIGDGYGVGKTHFRGEAKGLCPAENIVEHGGLIENIVSGRKRGEGKIRHVTG